MILVQSYVIMCAYLLLSSEMHSVGGSLEVGGVAWASRWAGSRHGGIPALQVLHATSSCYLESPSVNCKMQFGVRILEMKFRSVGHEEQ